MKRFVLVLAFLLVPGVLFAQSVLTPELLWQLKRVSRPVVSPDGRTFVYGMTTYDITENRGNTDLYLMPTTGGTPVQLTSFPGSESGATWHPDGDRIGFLSAQTGSMQLWEVNVDGSNPHVVSDIEGGISNFRYAPNGTYVSFTRDVKIDSTVVDRFPDLQKASARIIDDLMYRHWDSWHDFAYSHLFIAPYENGRIGEPIDVMESERFDTPLNPFGGVEQIGWSPDGTRIAYTSKKKTGMEAATSTNSAIYLYELASGQTTDLTEGMMGYDVGPVFSPDGRYLVWLSMEREGYEADRNRLILYDFEEGEMRELTTGFDLNVHDPVWSPDGSRIYFTSEVAGTIQIYTAEVPAGTIRKITEGMHDYGSVNVGATSDGQVLIASRMSISAPTEIYRVDIETGEAEPLTKANEDILTGVKMGEVQQRMVKATDGKSILTWVIYPPDFDPTEEYPALLYAQGGPQSAVSQFFSYRWNFQLMAANGYVVVAPNRRGLPGFGLEWNEEISGDWGGQSMRDLLSAIDEVAAEPYIDDDRLGAVGASYGGYSVYWLAGNHDGRFATFVAHAGVFNLESMYGATEELFFVNFDLEGPYWETPRPQSYDRYSPHRYVQNWDTPMLIIHGEKDYRVPVTEGFQAFTALQSKGIESRLLYYPEEGHWVLSPQNGLLWHRVFFDWLDRFLK